MRVLFLVPYPEEGPSNRYRVNQFIPYMEKNGINCRVSSFYSKEFYRVLYKKGHRIKKFIFFCFGTLKRLYDAISSIRYDAVFIHLEAYPIGPHTFEYFFKALRKPLIYDLDDAVYIPHSKSGLFNFIKWHKKVPQIIKMSDHVITCNDYLREYALKYNPNVSTIYTALDTEKFTLRKECTDKKLTIGWIGSHSTTKYLESLLPTLEKLGKKCDFDFLAVGAGKNILIPGVKVINRPWSLAREVADFHDIDIGVYPLLKDKFVNAKTGFKTRQYMACGIPSVVSNIGANREIVYDGKNAFLASNEREWINKLSLLLEKPLLRKKIGLEGRKTIERDYSLKVLAPKLKQVITDTVSKNTVKMYQNKRSD